jgi:hemolysin III
VSHQIAFFWSIAGAAALLGCARAGRATTATLVFCVSLACMFGTSALYHRLDWSRLKRVDHAAVFVAIAGGYTPLLALAPSSSGARGALVLTWIGASLGVLKAVLWPNAPSWITALACALLGWTLALEVVKRSSSVAPLCIALFVASGVLYTIGAVVYATRRPNPLPRVFGYHEVFHALVVLGTASLFVHVAMLLR